MRPEIAVEIFSLERVALWMFGAIISIAAFLDFVYFLSRKNHPKVRSFVAVPIRWVDRFFLSFYYSARVIPYILIALVISVLAPVYDMYTDASWSEAVLSGSSDGKKAEISWVRLLLKSHERTLPTFIHTAQVCVLLMTLWVYTLFWNRSVRIAGDAEMPPKQRGTRWGFIAGFVVFVMGPISWLLKYMGRHAEIVLFSA